MRRRALGLAGLAVVALVGVLVLVWPGAASSTVAVAAPACAAVAREVPGAAVSGLEVRPLCALPPEAATVWAQIRAGGPFRYDRDGVTFANREALLPARRSDFYREYTVPTPGAADRGARRLVTGGAAGPDQELYYTGDHYTSFVVVDAAAGP